MIHAGDFEITRSHNLLVSLKFTTDPWCHSNEKKYTPDRPLLPWQRKCQITLRHIWLQIGSFVYCTKRGFRGLTF